MARKRARSTSTKSTKKVAPSGDEPFDEGNVELAGDRAEETYLSLPGPIREVFVLVRCTGRKRMYLHLGTAGERFAYAHTLYSEGPSVLRVTPIVRRHALFAAFLRYLQALQGSVNLSGFSPGVCTIEPDVCGGLLEQLLREQLHYDPAAL